jgi:hypothetical protein
MLIDPCARDDEHNSPQRHDQRFRGHQQRHHGQREGTAMNDHRATLYMALDASVVIALLEKRRLCAT